MLALPFRHRLGLAASKPRAISSPINLQEKIHSIYIEEVEICTAHIDTKSTLISLSNPVSTPPPSKDAAHIEAKSTPTSPSEFISIPPPSPPSPTTTTKHIAHIEAKSTPTSLSDPVTTPPPPPPTPSSVDTAADNPPSYKSLPNLDGSLPYESYLMSAFDLPLPATPVIPPTPRLRPLKHPYIKSSGCPVLEKTRRRERPASGDLASVSNSSEEEFIPSISLKRPRTASTMLKREETPAEIRETLNHPLDLTHMRHVWHSGQVYLIDCHEGGKMFEPYGADLGAGRVWVEVEDEKKILRVRAKSDLWEERIRRAVKKRRG